MERFFFFPITVVPERHHRINARFLFVKKSLFLLFVDSILWNLSCLRRLLLQHQQQKSFVDLIYHTESWKYLPIQQHGDMMYTAVLYLFYLPKQEPYFILKAHQVKKQHRTFFQQRRFVFPFFFDLYNTSTLQPQTLQPDCYATLWECMWINAHKKNCI